MSGSGDDGGQLQLYSKFVAGFVCHIEKNEVETNADTFCLHGVSWGGGGVAFLPSHFLAFSVFHSLGFSYCGWGYCLRENGITVLI